MNLPRNVFRFEILLYASLILDAISLAFEDRTVTSGTSEQIIMAQSVASVCLILLLLYFVYLAARHRKFHSLTVSGPNLRQETLVAVAVKDQFWLGILVSALRNVREYGC